MIGETTPDGELGFRDAAHVPVVLVSSSQKMKPGDSVRFVDQRLTEVEKSKADVRHAIVDPFLKSIKQGDKFFVLLNPGLVVKLIHQFDVVVDAPPAPLPYPVPVPEEDDDYNSGCRGCY